MIDSSSYAIVLLPDEGLLDKTIQTSCMLRSFGTRFCLQKDTFFPHMTLYMAQIPNSSLKQIQAALSHIAKQTEAFSLRATKYHQDREGMIEVQYEKTDALVFLQREIIRAVNPLREGLRERNPLGYFLKDQLSHATGEEKENLEKYGYDEIGMLFRPHITFTRLINKEKMFALSLLPPVEQFSGSFPVIGFFTLGENGTCMEQIDTINLKNS
ncbi:MAG: DUF1045 domain-containing protein [Patescibacteria group bacterium]